jgi:hypothetical protein
VIDNASAPGLFRARNTNRFDDEATPRIAQELRWNCKVHATRGRQFQYRLSPLAQLSGLLFCFCRARRLVGAPFQVGAFARDRRGKPGGPPLLKLSLKVKRDSAHSRSSELVVAPVSRPQRARAHKGPSGPASGTRMLESDDLHLDLRPQLGRNPLHRMGLGYEPIDVIAIGALKPAQRKCATARYASRPLDPDIWDSCGTEWRCGLNQTRLSGMP